MSGKILFVNPRIADKSIVFAIDLLNPVSLCLPYMASMSLEEGFEVKIIDENYDEPNYQKEIDGADVICITSEFFGASRVRELCAMFRKLGKKVIIDGLYSTFASEDAMRYGDSIVIGEVEHIWRTVLGDIKRGQLQKVYKVDGFMDLKDLPFYTNDILPPHDYLFPVEATRGCRFKCDFCLEVRLYDFTFRARPVKDVVKQIEMSGEKNIHFMNCDIVGDPAHAKKLFKALKPLDILWGSQSTITIAEDDELLNLAAESGCFMLFFGLESVNTDSMKEAKKRWSKPDKYTKLMKKVHDAGIAIMGSFVFGFDSDGKDVFENTLAFVEENQLEIAHFVPLEPIAGTVFHQKFADQERLLHRDEGKFDHFHASFTPKQISKGELEEGIKYCWKGCYSKEGIKKRLSKFLRNGKIIKSQVKDGALSKEDILFFLNLDYKNTVNKHYH